MAIVSFYSASLSFDFPEFLNGRVFRVGSTILVAADDPLSSVRSVVSIILPFPFPDCLDDVGILGILVVSVGAIVSSVSLVLVLGFSGGADSSVVSTSSVLSFLDLAGGADFSLVLDVLEVPLGLVVPDRLAGPVVSVTSVVLPFPIPGFLGGAAVPAFLVLSDFSFSGFAGGTDFLIAMVVPVFPVLI